MPGTSLDALWSKITVQIIQPGLELLFALALAYFLYGVFEFVKGADSEDQRQTGQQHMLYGVVGMAIMFTAFGILRVICNTINC